MPLGIQRYLISDVLSTSNIQLSSNCHPFAPCCYPRLFENSSPEHPPGLVPPKYPDSHDTMSPEDNARVNPFVRRETLFYLYHVFNGGLNKVHLKALQDPLILSCQHLVDFAGRIWSGNLMILRGVLMRMCDIWSHG
jgi:hypothetical protein